jgi:hypothetical protein
MIKASAYYLAGGAVAVGGTAIGYDLMRLGRLAFAGDLHRREHTSYQRALEVEVRTQDMRVEAERAGVDPNAVSRRLDQLRDEAGTQALGNGREID